jgi:hypothetical protein
MSEALKARNSIRLRCDMPDKQPRVEAAQQPEPWALLFRAFGRDPIFLDGFSEIVLQLTPFFID